MESHCKCSLSFFCLFIFLFPNFCFVPPSPGGEVEIIEVDIKHPERNREVKVIHFTDVEKAGVLHNGFDIMIDGIDQRDYTDESNLEITK